VYDHEWRHGNSWQQAVFDGYPHPPWPIPPPLCLSPLAPAARCKLTSHHPPPPRTATSGSLPFPSTAPYPPPENYTRRNSAIPNA